MNPVPLMELVELIRGIATADATFEAAKEFVTKLGKQIYKKLKVYAGPEHPHGAQNPETLKIGKEARKA